MSYYNHDGGDTPATTPTPSRRADMQYPKNLCTNIKGIEADLEGLKKNVLVIGPNGGGKTAMLHALQLALSGAARDFAGRDEVKLAAALHSLKPEGAEVVVSTVTLDDGAVAEWGMNGAGKPRYDNPVPFRMLYEEAEAALVGTNIKGRALPWLCANFVPAAVVRATRPDMDEATLKALVAYRDQHQDKPGTSGLVAIYNHAKKDAAAHKRQGKSYAQAYEVLKSLDVDQAVPILTSILALTGFQVMRENPICGVCAQDADLPTFTERMDQAKAGLATRQGGTWVPKHLTDHLQQLVNDHTAQAAHAEAVAEVVLEWMDAALQAYIPQLVELVNSYLPETHTISFDIENKRWRILRLGVEASSGAETVITVTAFAAAAADRSQQPCLIVPPDRAYDGNSIRLLMDILGKSQAAGWLQLISRPKGRTRKDWSYLDLDSRTLD